MSGDAGFRVPGSGVRGAGLEAVAVDRGAEQAALRAELVRQAPQGDVGGDGHAVDEANAAAAASTVRSTCSGPCASDGNHASNCDGGG